MFDLPVDLIDFGEGRCRGRDRFRLHEAGFADRPEGTAPEPVVALGGLALDRLEFEVEPVDFRGEAGPLVEQVPQPDGVVLVSAAAFAAVRFDPVPEEVPFLLEVGDRSPDGSGIEQVAALLPDRFDLASQPGGLGAAGLEVDPVPLGELHQQGEVVAFQVPEGVEVPDQVGVEPLDHPPQVAGFVGASLADVDRKRVGGVGPAVADDGKPSLRARGHDGRTTRRPPFERGKQPEPPRFAVADEQAAEELEDRGLPCAVGAVQDGETFAEVVDPQAGEDAEPFEMEVAEFHDCPRTGWDWNVPMGYGIVPYRRAVRLCAARVRAAWAQRRESRSWRLPSAGTRRIAAGTERTSSPRRSARSIAGSGWFPPTAPRQAGLVASNAVQTACSTL